MSDSIRIKIADMNNRIAEIQKALDSLNEERHAILHERAKLMEILLESVKNKSECL